MSENNDLTTTPEILYQLLVKLIPVFQALTKDTTLNLDWANISQNSHLVLEKFHTLFIAKYGWAGKSSYEDIIISVVIYVLEITECIKIEETKIEELYAKYYAVESEFDYQDVYQIALMIESCLYKNNIAILPDLPQKAQPFLQLMKTSAEIIEQILVQLKENFPFLAIPVIRQHAATMDELIAAMLLYITANKVIDSTCGERFLNTVRGMKNGDKIINLYKELMKIFGDPMPSVDRHAINLHLNNQNTLLTENIEKYKALLRDRDNIEITPPIGFWDMPNTLGGLDKICLWDCIFNRNADKFSEHSFEKNRTIHHFERIKEPTDSNIRKFILGRVYDIIENSGKLTNYSISNINHFLFYQKDTFLYTEYRKTTVGDFKSTEAGGLKQVNYTNMVALNRNFKSEYQNLFFSYESETKTDPITNKSKSADVDVHVITAILTNLINLVKKKQKPASIILGTGDVDYLYLVKTLSDLDIPVFLISTLSNLHSNYGNIPDLKCRKFVINTKDPIESDIEIEYSHSIKNEVIDYINFKHKESKFNKRKVYLNELL